MDEIDVRPRQVSIKAIIAQVTLGDELKFGIDALAEGTFAQAKLGDDPKNGIDLARTSDLKDERVEVVNVRKTAPGSHIAILDIARPSGPADQLPGQLLTIDRDLEVYLADLAQKSGKMEIVASTHVVASDSKESLISSGDGLKITVSPRINWKDEVVLTIGSELVTPTEGDPKSTGIQSIHSTMWLGDGAALVSGGIVREKDGERKELLIFIQPRILPGEKAKVDDAAPKAKRVEVE